MKQKRKFPQPVNFEEYQKKEKEMNKFIDEFGIVNVMSCIYRRKELLIPNFYVPEHIAGNWNVTERSVEKYWDEIIEMVEVEGFAVFDEPLEYCDAYNIKLKEEKN